MAKVTITRTVHGEAVEKPKYYTRFSLLQRIEHIILLLSFSILGLTGLPQKFATHPVSEGFIAFLGGIEQVRVIHRVSAVVLMALSIYHLLTVLYRVFVERTQWSMLPVIDDFKHLIDDIKYYFGLSKHKAYYGRYNYAEKAEYLAVVWGTIIMAITGFMMWNPIATTNLLPGEIIPAAKAAHGGEAVLAVLAIILWHFYHVHLRQFNKSMFTGKISEEEMKHEHPAELAELKSHPEPARPPLRVLRRRQQIYYPVAAVMTLVLGFGLVRFATFEETAIDFVPSGETAPIYAPITPTPRPSPTPAPTPVPGEGAAPGTWDGEFSALFRNRCGTCHGFTAVSGLSLATYDDALKGGNSGPAIVPGDPDASLLVLVQSQGNHPGQLTIDELNRVIDWIKKGAPER